MKNIILYTSYLKCLTECTGVPNRVPTFTEHQHIENSELHLFKIKFIKVKLKLNKLNDT